MGSFKTSDGERLTKTFIDGQIKKAKKAFARQRECAGIMYCEACGTTNDRLDCSHIISVNDCQNDGRCEFAFDVDNMQRECRSCHMETESGLINCCYHANYRYKEEFIKKYNESKVKKYENNK